MGNDMNAVAGVVRMLDGVDSVVAKYSSQPSEELRNISVQTAKTNPMWADAEAKGDTTRLMEAEMISGQAEGQLLQLLVKFGQVKRVLDIGTFTGYSSLAMAEALPEDGHLVTLEREEVAAKMAGLASALEASNVSAPSLSSTIGYACFSIACVFRTFSSSFSFQFWSFARVWDPGCSSQIRAATMYFPDLGRRCLCLVEGWGKQRLDPSRCCCTQCRRR